MGKEEEDIIEFMKLYRERYGEDGPEVSVKTAVHKENCDCWACQLEELRKWKESQS